MQDILRDSEKAPPKHDKEQAALLASYKEAYSQWHYQLKCGFGLLMYGFGSKKTLLEDFASGTLTDGPAVVVNGYLPAVKIKHVVFTVADALWESTVGGNRAVAKRKKLTCCQPSSSQSLEDLLAFLQGMPESECVYVIVHNIDGPGVRDEHSQQVLALVAACTCVRLVASIDNVNASLLWDKQTANTKFNWWWHHTPTYFHYSVEGTHLPVLLNTKGLLENARSAGLVLKSLTPNAQSVFRTLAENQIAHHEEDGLPLHRLYTLCRERFLVSSELTLRAHLTEFKDHELIRFKRGADGQDGLHIPLPLESLKALLQDLNAA